MRNWRAKLVLKLTFLLLIGSGTSYGQLSENNYRIYSVNAQREVPLKQIIKDMSDYDVLFFGEEHNDSVGHFLEAELLKGMHKKYGSKTALSMEMFDRDVQTVMDEYLSGGILERHFIKDARVWSNYDNYRPMVEFAKEEKLQVVCANAAGRYTNLVGREGQEALLALPESSQANMAPLPYDTASGDYHRKLMELTGHGGADTMGQAAMMAMMGSFNLIVAQSLWDATMAYSIAEHLKRNKSDKILQVNGRFHSDEGFAVVTQLKKYTPTAKVLVISSGPDDSFPDIDWSQHIGRGDYIIITDPSVPRTFEE